jgi:chromosome segregation ATPase
MYEPIEKSIETLQDDVEELAETIEEVEAAVEAQIDEAIEQVAETIEGDDDKWKLMQESFASQIAAMEAATMARLAALESRLNTPQLPPSQPGESSENAELESKLNSTTQPEELSSPPPEQKPARKSRLRWI